MMLLVNVTPMFGFLAGLNELAMQSEVRGLVVQRPDLTTRAESLPSALFLKRLRSVAVEINGFVAVYRVMNNSTLADLRD